ncbi:MAG: hypothetical protein IPL83_02455 [Bdellovibrionales bacterium]|nr:hypothetical protein [Bdellovibrionales bacterium]
MGRTKKKQTTEDRVYNYIKKYVRCRDIHLKPGEYSTDYNEVIRNTRTQSELAKDLGLAKSSVARAIGELSLDEKVLVYRFRKNGVYIPKDDYDPDVHVSSVARVAYKSDHEKYIGERILETVSGSLLASRDILQHLSISFKSPKLDDHELRLHFSVGSALLTFTVGKGVFGKSGGLPVTVFLSQHSPLDVSSNNFVPTADHVRAFGNQLIILRLPNQSLLLPSKSGYGQSFEGRCIPAFGNIALTFYPTGNDVWVTQLLGLWSPTYAKLTDQHLLSRTEVDENDRAKNIGPDILNLERWSRQGRIWPEPLSKISRGQPPKLKEFFPREDQSRYTGGHSLPTIGSKKLQTPRIFDLDAWLDVSRIVCGYSEPATKSQIETFKSEMDARTWSCQTPCVLGFRHFHLAVTR